MILSRRLTLGAAMLPLLSLAFAPPAARAAEPPYLTAKQLDISVLLPFPPPRGGAVERADVDAVIALQKGASPERIALAQADAEESVFDMFTRTLGDGFVAAKLPKTAAFFARVGESEDEVVDPAKKIYARIRPYLAFPDEVKGIPPVTKSGSWPSGHTTRVTMCAIIMAQILPEKRDAIWARAAEYAQSRLVLGMHYPLDVEMGRRIGTVMAAMMLADPAFRADLEPVRAEVRAAMGL